MIKLTARQEQILGLIRDAIETTGFPEDDGWRTVDAIARKLLFIRLIGGLHETLFKPTGPDRGILDLHVADAADARLDAFDISGDQFFGHLDLDPEH